MTATLARSSGGSASVSYRSEFGGVLATADVDGDGAADLFVEIGVGASTTWVGILTFDGQALRLVTLDLARAETLLVGGGVRHGDALECRIGDGTPQLVWRSTSNYTAADQWDVVERAYEWSGKTLVLVSITRSDVRVSAPYAPPSPLGRYYGIDCPGLRAPPF